MQLSTDENIIKTYEEYSVKLSSTKSMRISLDKVNRGEAGLSERRKRLLERVPRSGDWTKFEKNRICMKDIAYLTAKTGDEFAILNGKKEDILFHGSKCHCNFEGVLYDGLMKGKLRIYGHSHPTEMIPIPSQDDRETLRMIKQKKSYLISAVTGREVEFFDDEFNIVSDINKTERSEFGDVDIR